MSEPAAAIPPPPPIGHHPRAAARDRSTVVVREDVIYRFRGDQREVADGRHSFGFDGGDEVCTRVVPVGPDWVPVNTYWVPRPSVVWVENRVGFDRRTLPTPAEAAAEDAAVVELGIGPDPGAGPPETLLIVGFARVRPGRCCRFEPVPLGPAAGTALWVRCPAGGAEIKVVLVPGPAGEADRG